MATNLPNEQIEPPIGDCSQSAVQPSTRTPFLILRMAKDLQLGIAKHKNFVFSPCSIQLAMSLIAHGASGSTLDQLLSFSQVENLDHLTSVASKLVATLNQPQPDDTQRGPKLNFVGGAWVDHSLCLSPSFASCAQNIYKVKAEAVDFKDEIKAREVVNKVNKWAEESTGGLINSVLPSLDPDTRLVLANALYFNGMWKETFRKSLTRDSDFYLHYGETVKVPFMCSKADQFIRTFDDFKVLRLPYNKGNGGEAGFSMYIILPHQRDGLWNLVSKVGCDPHFLEKYISNDAMEVRVGEFMVPKFKMTCDFEASQFLKAVGLNSCFSVEAEFNDMLLNPKLTLPLYISKVHHKSYIEIDEEGTEAAAVTVLQMRFCCAIIKPPTTPVDFVADHPFMFMMRDDHTGMVLFLGHVINPVLI